ATVAEQFHGVAQAILAAVSAVELEPCHAGRQVQLVVRQQRLLGLDLPVAQRRGDRLAAEIHEGRRPQQPDRTSPDIDLRRLAEQPGLQAKTPAAPLAERVDEAEPGVVPGPRVFRPRVAEADDESQSFHRDGPGPQGRTRLQNRRARNALRRSCTGSPACGPGRPSLREGHLSSPALVAGTSPPSPSSSSAAGSSRPSLAITTASSWSLPSFSCGISTPSGSLMSDR